MNVLLYNIAIRTYNLLIHLAMPFSKKARLWAEGRKNYFRNLQSRMYKNTGPVIWFHCASLGEFEQARPLIEKLKKEKPEFSIVLTFYSPSGFEIRKNYEHANFVFYLPLDTSFNAEKFVRVINPRIALFVKYEFWYHFLTELTKKNIPVISFSSIFRDDQIYFKSYGSFFLSILKKFTHLFVQDNESLHLLHENGIDNVTIAGDTRFDRVKEICDSKKEFPLIANFKNGQRLLIAGSTWEEDMDLLIHIINDSSVNLKFIIAPHEIKESSIAWVEKRSQKKTVRYSQLTESNGKNSDILIIDNIGMLSSIYQYGEFAYVGGAFGKGLHNILEAATFGMPIFFGPNYKKFREAIELIDTGSGISVKDKEELIVRFKDLYNNEVKRKDLAERSRKYVESNTGATEKIIGYCRQILN